MATPSTHSRSRCPSTSVSLASGGGTHQCAASFGEASKLTATIALDGGERREVVHADRRHETRHHHPVVGLRKALAVPDEGASRDADATAHHAHGRDPLGHVHPIVGRAYNARLAGRDARVGHDVR
eukprot:5387736-Prymnesium_polylepis.1